MAHIACGWVIALIGLGPVVYAAEPNKDYDPSETRCMAGNDKMIERLLSSLDVADQAFPNVPPEEAQFLSAESSRAQRVYMQEAERKKDDYSESNGIYSAIDRRPLYYVWSMRKDLVEARKALRAVLQMDDQGFVTYRMNPEAEKLERATKAMLPLNSFARSLGAAIDHSNWSSKDSSTTWPLYGGLYLNVNLGNFISCKLAKVMGRQPL